jgi:cysteinyl-tRNA synthetase, unknown class
MPFRLTRRSALARLSGWAAANTLMPAAHALAPAQAIRTPNAATRDAARKKLRAAKSWAYQLKYWHMPRLDGPTFDVFIMDNAILRPRAQPRPVTPDELKTTKQRGSSPDRLVLAYMSIGEAESYRGYWREDWNRAETRPAWIRTENPDWINNYPVNFWEPAWQRLMLGTPEAYLDQIIAQGFDGVYLDRADVYEDLKAIEPRAEALMIDFVTRLASYARAVAPSFLVVLQNAEELLRHAPIRTAVDGVAKESLFYGIDKDGAANSADTVEASANYLKLAQRDGRPVFVVEYVYDAAKAADARRRANRLGFPIYFAPRELDFLVLAPPDSRGTLPSPPIPAIDRSLPYP